MKNTKFSAVVHLLSDARGIYMPRDFAESFDLIEWGLYEDYTFILSNPDDDSYWDEWQIVLDSAKYIDKDGNEFRLYQDGDLWAICYDKMTNEEKTNFGFDIEEEETE